MRSKIRSRRHGQWRSCRGGWCRKVRGLVSGGVAEVVGRGVRELFSSRGELKGLVGHGGA